MTAAGGQCAPATTPTSSRRGRGSDGERRHGRARLDRACRIALGNPRQADRPAACSGQAAHDARHRRRRVQPRPRG